MEEKKNSHRNTTHDRTSETKLGMSQSSHESFLNPEENSSLKETTAPDALKHLRLGRTASSIDSITNSAENNNGKNSENENIVKKSLSYEEAVDADLYQFIQAAAEGKLPKKARSIKTEMERMRRALF